MSATASSMVAIGTGSCYPKVIGHESAQRLNSDELKHLLGVRQLVGALVRYQSGDKSPHSRAAPNFLIFIRQQFFHVFPDDIDFEVDVVTGLQMREIRDFPGLRDDGDFEEIIAERGDG
jgi:hypothetical protein